MGSRRHTDFLVIGSGIAGLRYALTVAQHSRVTIVTKKTSAESNTNYAQGGIAAVMSADDNFAEHINDTLECGGGICDPKVVEHVVKEGPQRVQELLAMGAAFTEKNGKLHLGREGGHSAKRIVHATDATGKEIERTLLHQLQQHPQVELLEYHYAVELLVDDTRCTGARILDERTGELQPLCAPVTLLASGGSGQVYQHTTNPLIATGDGLAMARRAGAAIANMEFFQFHPTVLYHPQGDSFLISEAVRGAGARLRNQAGEYFMADYHPQAELAPRDVVARAIHDQLQKFGDDFVWLDISHKKAESIRESFPTIHATCLTLGIDMTKEALPVVPAAHYQCGGVVTDLQGRTDVEGLFACGEVAYTGLHGANRLASNSLLEALVFSHHAAEASIDYHQNAKATQAIVSHETILPKNQANEDRISTFRREVQKLMSTHVAIVRSSQGLQTARSALDAIERKMEREFADSTLTVPLCELRNLLSVARLIVTSAQLRKESRGLHYMLDYPNTDAALAHPTLIP